jgi:hypothetical protein
MNDIQTWESLLAAFVPLFNAPSFLIFVQIASAWVLCPGRRTITRLYALAEPLQSKAHDAYHRFIREADWHAVHLWKIVAKLIVTALYETGVICMDLDDTTFHKSGRKIEGAAWWRDAVRSTGTKVVHCFGLNVIVLTLRVNPLWGGEPLGLPINLRIHLKGGASLLVLAEEMIRETVSWFPGRCFEVCGDGFYASLMGKAFPPDVQLTSRMRRDAALYEMPPQKRPHTPGAPRKKGKRLPTPEAMALQIRNRQWKEETVVLRGKEKKRLVWSRTVLWYKVNPQFAVLLVICRDPAGKEPDDFFCTTDANQSARHVVESYAGRWSIEDTFKNTKQSLGAETPQSWKKFGPERIAHIAFLLYSLVWLWYLQSQGAKRTWKIVPWYPQKQNASFTDALASLRKMLWRKRIISMTGKSSVPSKIITTLIDVVAAAA